MRPKGRLYRRLVVRLLSVRSLESAAPILRAFRGGALERPNKRMHATRDTTDVMLRLGAGGRVMRGVRLLLRYQNSAD
jgi:hypothetical protein